jgi:hypothetical protein
MKNLVFYVFFGLSSSICQAQFFEGIISYELKMDAGNIPGAEMLNGLMMQMNMSIKGTKSRVVLDMGLMRQDVISDSEKGETILLMENEKKALVQKIETSSKEQKADYEWVKQAETLNILGYKCQKYVATFDIEGTKQKQEIWVYEGFKAQKGKFSKQMEEQNEFGIKGIEGIPMKMVMKIIQAGMPMTMNFVATKVEKKAIPDADFQIPSDFQITHGNIGDK